MKRIVLLLAIVVLAAIVWYVWQDKSANPTERASSNTTIDENQPVAGFDMEKYSTSEPGSIWLIVNKNRPIPADYVPDELVNVSLPVQPGKSLSELMLRPVAASALENMAQAASGDGVTLAIGSGYRSYELQQFYYDNYVATYGREEADKFSAKPGTSEHQTGLAADLATAEGSCYLEECFGASAEGQWLAENAYRFGFIIRYPADKSEITGYQYEPWHVRYVGSELAEQIHDSGKTLEEFFTE